jgi:hypothetical protein
VFGRYPRGRYSERLTELVLEMGREHVTSRMEEWQGRGWNPANLLGLIDYIITGSLTPSGSGNGRASPIALVPQETPAQREAREKHEAIMAELERERRREAERGSAVQAR